LKNPWPAAAGLALLTILATTGCLYMRARQLALDRFWAPVLGSGEPVEVGFPLNHFNGIMLRDAANPAL